ncbi:glycosyltransferase family 2 protein [Roseivivax marinus]|uniref:glycosyltransferase family 2 protein n=1 Tax=Roseivivax marinus TaxID=1379903 RepID=UPI001F03B6AE|nr:glycosyltransferase family 2 protein [Roseivivax marinus]UMA66051.1 glycosyltransferase family 2 protein [Roseivivax marinus]
MKVVAVTCVKNEGPFLLEWIAFNRLIGVTDFLFYSNDCTDGTDALLDALEAEGVVEHRANPAQGRNYQMEALKDAKRRRPVKAADWVWIADVDEFLNIHVPGHTIPELVAACGDPQAISVTFRFFANDGVETYQDRPVIAQFDRSHDPDIWAAEMAIEVKTLVRADFPLQYFGAHRPFHDPDRHSPYWTDGSGRPVPERFLRRATRRRIRAFPASGARQLASLNHYALRSLESYLVKNDRGDVNRENRAFDTSYWRDRNDPAVSDRSIQRHLPALDAEIARLKGLGRVGALHEAAVAAHRQRIRELLAREDYRAMADALRAAPRVPVAEAELCALLGPS